MPLPAMFNEWTQTCLQFSNSNLKRKKLTSFSERPLMPQSIRLPAQWSNINKSHLSPLLNNSQLSLLSQRLPRFKHRSRSYRSLNLPLLFNKKCQFSSNLRFPRCPHPSEVSQVPQWACNLSPVLSQVLLPFKVALLWVSISLLPSSSKWSISKCSGNNRCTLKCNNKCSGNNNNSLQATHLQLSPSVQEHSVSLNPILAICSGSHLLDSLSSRSNLATKRSEDALWRQMRQSDDGSLHKSILTKYCVI
jgi:hypothetical protein